MKGLIFLCTLCAQLALIFGYPSDSAGVGAFAYEDSSGNRYGGTYDLNDDGKVTKTSGNLPDNVPTGPFGPNFFPEWDTFFPSYFKNFENLLQEAFKDHIDSQKKALGAAEKAYELTSNQAGHLPEVPNRFDNFGGYNNYANPYNYMPMMGQREGLNAAYAGAFAGPGGFNRQIAALNPASPYQPNIDMVNYGVGGSAPGFNSVSSKSYSTSMNLNGRQVNHRGSQTYVNQNGKVSGYKIDI